MNHSQQRKKIHSLLQDRFALERKMLGAKPPFIAASLVLYRNVCGKPNCACKAGHTHGPYTYLSFKEKGRTRLKMVPRLQLENTAAAVERYREFQQALKRVRRLNRQAEALFKSLRASLIRKAA